MKILDSLKIKTGISVTTEQAENLYDNIKAGKATVFALNAFYTGFNKKHCSQKEWQQRMLNLYNKIKAADELSEDLFYEIYYVIKGQYVEVI